MSKKDYIAIAQAIARASGSDDILRAVIGELAAVLKADNPRFDRARFVRSIMERVQRVERFPDSGTVFKRV